jgi:hypothetical protein
MTKHRLLRLVLRFDQAGSAAFIVVALIAAPAFVLLPALRFLMWPVLIGYAVSLAAAGVLMAWGLARAMTRGEEMPMQMWRSLLGFEPLPARLPQDVAVRVGQPGEDEQQVGEPVQVLHGQ